MPLRFDELSPREFEELCLAWLHAAGHETRHVGAAGQDRGWDGRTTAPDGKTWCVQCKRVQSLTAADAVKELGKVRDDPEADSPDLWVLMATIDISAKLEAALKEKAAGRCEIRCFGRSDLEERIRQYPQVLDRFFAGSDPKARVVYLSACKADRDLAAALRRDLQLNLRRQVGSAWNVVWTDPTDSRLPEIPEEASWGVVVVSPEALADQQLMYLWHSALCQGNRSGRRRLVAVSVAPSVPWPAWLTERFERVDLPFDTYRIDLAAIISKWIGTTEKKISAEALEIEGPGFVNPRLPKEVSSALTDWLAPVMQRKTTRQLLATTLGLGLQTALDDFDTPLLRASAAIVLNRGDDDPTAGALRLIDLVLQTLDEDESTERLDALRAIGEQLRQARVETPTDLGLLPTWLRKVRRDHERLVDYFQQRQELDLLDRVYVELEMLPDARHPEPIDAAKGKAGQGLLLRDATSLEDLLALGPEDDVWITRRWVVRGDPGSGKTTLLRHLACRLAQDDERRWVPIFQSLPVLLRSREPLLDRIERIMVAETEREGLAKVLDREGQAGRLLLLLDGLDEVGPELRNEAESLLRRLSERWPETPVVVSTRPIGYRRFSREFREVQLLPLDPERRLDFLAAWFGRADCRRDERKANNALQQLEASGLDELASNPLYLTLMAMLLEQGESPEKNRSKLYQQVFRLLLEGKHKHEKPEPIERPELVHQALRLLAFTLTEDNRDAESRSAIEERLYRGELETVRTEIKKVPRWDGPLRHFLDDLAEKVGILGPHDGDDADWRFWHRTFKEALTAELLASLPREELLARAEQAAGQESRWAEPFALATGQVEAPDDLVRQLVQSNRTLGLRALATAQGVSDDTLDDILALTEDLEERSKVFEQIPAQLDDPERALRLIDRLRRRTRNGYDLYWLHLAAAVVAEMSEDHAEAALRMREGLFGHIPAPDPELFRWVETPKDGKVPLWCEIHAGSGGIGSPDNEKGRFDWEGPQHSIEVDNAFWLAAVPVTNAQYATFDPDRADGSKPHHPFVGITWYEAVSFCRWLSTLPGFRTARLPTEEEWEYSCRAGTTTRFWNGDSEQALAEVGWYDSNSEIETYAVGEKPANPWGLYDVHGNVEEWTASRWKDNYSEQENGLSIDPTQAPADLADLPRDPRVVRGGSSFDPARWARSACRSDGSPWSGFRGLGFRVLLPFPPSDP